MEIDSSQDYKIIYYYEQIHTDNDFEFFKNKLISKSNTKKDTLQISKYINNLKIIQLERLNIDTIQTCTILLSGEPIEFKFLIDEKELKFSEINFKNTRISDDYPHFENHCQIAKLRKSNKTITARYESETLSYDCKLNLSYSTIKIEHNINIPMTSEISYKRDLNGGPPIPTEKINIVKGAIEINHKWSN